MELRVKIKLGDAAMQTGADLAEALDRIAGDLRVHGVIEGRDSVQVGIRDLNGNTVGSWEVAEPLPVIGRERMLVNKLAKFLLREAGRRHEHAPIHETERGARFDLRLFEGNEYTGRVVRVAVELERVEP